MVQKYSQGPSAEHPLKRPSPIIESIEPDAFITCAMIEFMGDVQLAQLALIRGTSDCVRAIATYLIDDCNRVLLDIARIATRKNLPVPKSLDQEHNIILEYMRERNGADFDSAYMERIDLNHRYAIKLFKRGQAIKIPEISAFASRVLAMIEARVKLGRQLSGDGNSGLDGSGSPHSGARANAPASSSGGRQ
jgi:putative membrane protein